MKKQITTLFSAILGGAIALGGYHYFIEKKVGEPNEDSVLESPNVVNTNFQQGARFNFDENSFVNASKKTVNSVVHVKNMTVAPEITSIFDLFYGNVPQQGGKERLAGTGSGVIISPDGYIVTNNHVITGASSVQVTLNDNKTYKAEIIGTDSSSDIALLKIKTDEKLPFLTFADSDNTQIGEWVLAVGNPFNLTSTVTGNSGGALVNLNGDLIGINTAIASSNSGTFMGYSFAVPSNIAKKVVEDLIEYGNVQKGVLGVSGMELNSETADKLKVKETEGFYVSDVESASGADKAGIKKGDIIKEIDNLKIRTFSDLIGHINTKRPNDKVEVSLIRDSNSKKVMVTLQKNTSLVLNNIGMIVKDLTEEDKRVFKVQKGVKITNISDIYKQNGIDLEGKVLISINNKEIVDTNQLKNIVNELNPQQRNSFIIINKKGEKERYFF